MILYNSLGLDVDSGVYWMSLQNFVQIVMELALVMPHVMFTLRR